MAYSTREIGHILGLPPYTVRYYACKGLGRHGQGKGHYYKFSFQELLLFKTISRLLYLGVSLRRIKRIMSNLPEQMPKGDPVTAVKIWTEGENVLVRHGNETWDPESGQGVFEFSTDQVRDNVVSILEEYRAEEAY
jgi:DNA-binding transcriptional MerR regulator